MPLKVSDGMGVWIDDFKKSDAPQFKGKSDKERRDQAIAAYLSAKNEQVDESSDAYGKSLEKEKEKRLTSNDQDKLARLRRMMDREKTKVAREPKGEYDRKVGSYLKKKYNKEDVELGEETTFEVEVEGLPTMYVKAKSPGEVKANLRKIVKQPSMITGVSRVTDAEMKKVFRDKAQGREKDDDDLDEAVKKDEREYGYEGDMAISQLKTIMRHAEHMMGMLKEDTDLPEWVQSKITLATDYMQTAHDYMMSEMTEGTQQVAELSQNTLRQYHGKSALDIRKKRDQLNKGTLSTADHKKAQRRVTGINRAANKMEEVEEGTGSLKPGWMLKADPKLGAAVKAKQDLAKKRQATYGDKSAGKSVDTAEGIQQKLRKYVPGYAKKQIDKKMDAEKFGKTDVDRDANYWRYKKVMDKLKKEKASMCEQCGKVHEGKCS